MAEERVSQDGVEVTYAGSPSAIVSQDGIEATYAGAPSALVSQDGIEVLYSDTSTAPEAMFTQMGVTIFWRPAAPPSPVALTGCFQIQGSSVKVKTQGATNSVLVQGATNRVKAQGAKC